MRVAIVGAGLSGLSAGRALVAGGAEAVIFEKSRGVGGRLATRRKDGFLWDTGATSIAPRGRALEVFIDSLGEDPDLVRIAKPIWLHENLRPVPGDRSRAMPRFVYRSGITGLAKRLARDLDVRLETNVSEITADGDQYIVAGEKFDAVILTSPVPQACALLWGLGESRPVAHVRYRSCISVLLGYATVALPEVPYFALLNADSSHPLQWLSLESVKSPGRAPEGGCAIVAQMTETYSFQHYMTSDALVISDVTASLVRLYGEAFSDPTVSDVKRWKYSQPTGTTSFDKANPAGSRVLITGDGLAGPRAEDAFDSGIEAAQRLLKELA